LAAGALLTDYILTVAVSVSAGTRAITSAIPKFHDYRIFIAIIAIAFLTWLNLRGIRESGTIFALPTYAFILGIIIVIVWGFVRSMGWFGISTLPTNTIDISTLKTVTDVGFLWLILRAFAAGCTALTGIEAISDGVQAFKPPETKNAAKTMVIMAIIAMVLFIGISYLSTHMNLIPSETDSILSQMTRNIVGNGFLYYWVQIFTMLILILAANTGFQDFPRLSYFLARDNFLPRWMLNRGDRLVYNGGIVTLAILSTIIVVIFQANEISMLPLYAIGVMLSFTLSQAGMVILLTKIGEIKPDKSLKTSETTLKYEKGWRWKRLSSFIGAFATLIVFIILVITKFVEGAWIIVITIPLIVSMFYSIRSHYHDVSEALRTKDLIGKENQLVTIADIVILPIGDIHKGTLRALQYANRLSTDVRAVSVTTNEEMKNRLITRWNRFPKLTEKAELICLDYDYRDVIQPLLSYIQSIKENEFPEEVITVVIPEFITQSSLTKFLHNRTADILRREIINQKNIVIIEIPFHI